ncbi:Crp/Fnr family transcriptional regulator [Persicitalea jodogahamensis]|nr:Crp/Fnr family transcriptional regulator [Persicitalea jodogahamensis]
MSTIDTSALREAVMRIHPLNDEEMSDFLAVWTPVPAKRKEILTQAGSTETNLYFIQKGVQRLYYLDNEGREATLMFSYAPSFGGVIDSYFTQQPSRYYYETLTASAMLRMSAQDIDRLLSKYPAIEKMIRIGMSGIVSGLMERMVEIQAYSSEEKFRALLRRSPHILQIVPHKYLANYLGMDATNFSKLLNRVRI